MGHYALPSYSTIHGSIQVNSTTTQLQVHSLQAVIWSQGGYFVLVSVFFPGAPSGSPWTPLASPGHCMGSPGHFLGLPCASCGPEACSICVQGPSNMGTGPQKQPNGKVTFSVPLPNRKSHFFYVPFKPKYNSPGPLVGLRRVPRGFRDPPIWPPSSKKSSPKSDFFSCTSK